MSVEEKQKPPRKRILVTGGAGYIGSHTSLELLDAGFHVTIVDNLANSNQVSVDRIRNLAKGSTEQTLEFHKLDVCDFPALEKFTASVAPFDAAIHFAKKIIATVLKNGLQKNTCLNVNIPKGKFEDIKGIKIGRQGNAYWEDSFDKRTDTFGKDYFWLTGEFTVRDKGEDTDMWALENNYVSVVPTQFDMTAHHLIGDLNEWNFDQK